MCGEQQDPDTAGTQYKGSPPRVRGTGKPEQTIQCQTRITPACAGNSVPISKKWRQCKDHPRVCGEQQAAIQSNDTEAGSPPRVRGTAAQDKNAATSKGITPACAGNS